MKLGNKNLLYSIILATFLMLFLVGYFIWMLPSLYVDHQMDLNLESIVDQQKTYMEKGNYEGVVLQNPLAAITIEIPSEADGILITNQMGSARLTAKDDRLKQILREMLEMTQEYKMEDKENEKDNKKENNNENGNKDNKERGLTDEQMNRWKDSLKDMFGETNELPFDIEVLHMNKFSNYANEFSKYHMIDDMLVLESGVTDSQNQYINYIAIQEKNGGLVVSFLPVITPRMDEIRPVVMQSIPMLTCVILLMVLLFSQVYSKGIVSPMVKLGTATKGLMESDYHKTGLPEKMKERKDETGLLAQSVDELYRQLLVSYQQLKIKNEELQEENKRQEVFLRASSHQLKTPIAAALLLLDGMIGKVGKYKDTDAYLPKVKEQLLSMRKMVEEILYLNRCGENIQSAELNVYNILENSVRPYQFMITDKKINLSIEGKQDLICRTDPEIFAKILDNLISNAVNYTPDGERICISMKENKILIHNTGVLIPEDILPHIFDPFVKGNHVVKSHGLGLYIASYYAELLEIKISMENAEDGVTATLSFTACI